MAFIGGGGVYLYALICIDWYLTVVHLNMTQESTIQSALIKSLKLTVSAFAGRLNVMQQKRNSTEKKTRIRAEVEVQRTISILPTLPFNVTTQCSLMYPSAFRTYNH